MAMIMGLGLRKSGAASAPQRPLLGKNVARGELCGTGEGQIFAHARRGRCGREPGLLQPAGRIADPGGNTTEAPLLGEVLGNRANECVQPSVAGQDRLLLDRREARRGRWGEIERIDKFAEGNIAWRPRLDSLDRFSEGIWVHRLFPPGSWSSTGSAAFRPTRR